VVTRKQTLRKLISVDLLIIDDRGLDALERHVATRKRPHAVAPSKAAQVTLSRNGARWRDRRVSVVVDEEDDLRNCVSADNVRIAGALQPRVNGVASVVAAARRQIKNGDFVSLPALKQVLRAASRERYL